ncbi:lipocalin family protein [Celeribacter indicus]|uniref:Lipocalin family protein n=1 Tax=Celeribacter indicus TaxID=1208324 RepID=A0A0B5E4H5_9RHOB|nr:lipocalin family protein [Celeribacter indicus]AJE48265.1 Lipocalin family protein [Celeribacter indicus]SDW71076.1 apolipoprotein D and lipocalin family protein [Celeribacter indicus]
MRGLIAVMGLLALLAGCAGTGERAAQPTGTRDAQVAMSSIAALDTGKFAGRWYEVAGFVPEGASCTIGAVTFAPQRSGDLTVTEGPCADGRPVQGVARRIGPGRYAFKGEELWVLWVDGEYHTAVIGYPSGAAHVLSRDLVLPPDRRAAVEGILSWNGYDVSRLRPARRR